MRNLSNLEKYRNKEAEIKLYGVRGDETCGIFKVFVKGKSFNVIASSDCGWDHVSVSPGTNRKNGTPTWDEMCAIKDMFFESEEVVIQYHPAKSEYVNFCDNCLHLWRPTAEKLPTPPRIFV